MDFDKGECEREKKRLRVFFALLALYGANRLPYAVNQFRRASEADAAVLFMDVLLWGLTCLPGVLMLLGWAVQLIKETAKGGEKMFLLRFILSAQKAICRADEWSKTKKYALPLVFVLQTLIFISVMLFMRDVSPINVNLFMIPVLLGVILRKGAKSYFTTVKGFAALTFFHCLLISVFLSLWINETHPFINTVLAWALIFGPLWVAASLIADTETANAVNIVSGLGITFLYAILTFGMTVFDLDGISVWLAGLIFTNTDVFGDASSFAAFLLLFSGIHALAAAAVTAKGYMLKRLAIGEYDP